ncbi:MAG: DUF3109 family protein [Bacteroidales bacterium]|nr:DUF3109 family protein [Bacteroidales bacterium]MBN2756609.1 DUF3109 family protein [Bacteroidales bacterium]
MIEIGKCIVTKEVIQEKFVCDLNKCKGMCCVEGDSGAPLEEDEIDILDEIYNDIKPYLREEGIKAIEKQGKYKIDWDGDYVTPLINEKECAYAIFEEGIAKCAVEKAYLDGKVDFKKPISCHLYPIRVKKLTEYDALNYDRWKICKPAISLGEELNLNVYKFLEEPLVRKYGKEWFSELKLVADELKKAEKSHD